MHYLLGYNVDHINEFLVNLGLRGMARIHPHKVRQAKPVTIEILLKFSEKLNFRNDTDKVFWCLFLFAFFLFARKSNLVPTTKEDLKSQKFLCRKDVCIEQGMLIVTFRYSKTIQFGERVLKTPLLPIEGSVLCPVKAFQNMSNSIHIQPDDPLFTLPNKKCIWYHQFQSKLKQLVEKIGLNPEEYSTHGFRRAGTSFAFKSGVSSLLIKHHGDWRSDAYESYVALTLQDKICVAEKMRYCILHNAV